MAQKDIALAFLIAESFGFAKAVQLKQETFFGL
jgi:hypothetical protein